jgi:thiol-disulfide isomerase/thioredoxin
MKRATTTLPLMLAATLVCSALLSAQPSNTTSAPKAASSATQQKPSRTLLFFINPHGQPCQMQESIIAQNAAKINAQVNVRYIKTTDEQNYPLFQKYAVRSLPMLVVIDEHGTVVHRFTPGIRSAQEILGAL